MKSKNLYVNLFSDLKFGIQSSKIVYYNLCYDKIFGIQIVVKKNMTVEEDLVYISEDEDLVIDIIKYLYENSIDTALFRNIIDDLLIKIKCEK